MQLASSEVIRERAQRHARLMKLIRNYTRTSEQNSKLERIKVSTMMEINLRFLRSSHNRHYRFPKSTVETEEDSEDSETPHETLCDLFAQNQALKGRSLSSKIISMDSSRRINSLEIEKNNWQHERLLRLNAKSKQHLSLKRSRKNSLAQPFARPDKLTTRLPQLRREKLKTEEKQENGEIQSVIGRKLATESSESKGKIKGLAKYLKQVEQKQKEGQTRRKPLPQMFL